jgi:hypothetical protein
VTTYVNWACHICPEKYPSVFELRDHLKVDHGETLLIKVDGKYR